MIDPDLHAADDLFVASVGTHVDSLFVAFLAGELDLSVELRSALDQTRKDLQTVALSPASPDLLACRDTALRKLSAILAPRLPAYGEAPDQVVGRFCSHCGTQIDGRFCSQCGNPIDGLFCQQCRTVVAQPSVDLQAS